jgi:hypothetical protein
MIEFTGNKLFMYNILIVAELSNLAWYIHCAYLLLCGRNRPTWNGPTLTVLYSKEKVGGQETVFITFCEDNTVFREKERKSSIEGLLHVDIDEHLSGFAHA